MKMILLSLLCFTFNCFAGLTPEQKKALDTQIENVKMWTKDTAILDEVKAINKEKLPQYKDMNQDTWKALPVLDAKVRDLTKNKAAEFLKTKKGDIVTEAFLNAMDGTKVALLSKTTGWSHKGKAKHDDPMNGKVWIGEIEQDESTGLQQIQIAVPVLDGDKAIGSLVVGFSVAKLK